MPLLNVVSFVRCDFNDPSVLNTHTVWLCARQVCTLTAAKPKKFKKSHLEHTELQSRQVEQNPPLEHRQKFPCTGTDQPPFSTSARHTDFCGGDRPLVAFTEKVANTQLSYMALFTQYWTTVWHSCTHEKIHNVKVTYFQNYLLLFFFWQSPPS